MESAKALKKVFLTLLGKIEGRTRTMGSTPLYTEDDIHNLMDAFDLLEQELNELRAFTAAVGRSGRSPEN